MKSITAVGCALALVLPSLTLAGEPAVDICVESAGFGPGYTNSDPDVEQILKDAAQKVCEERIAEIRKTLVLDATRSSLQTCLRNTAANLDDGISPATDIASAVASNCRTQWKDFAILMGVSPQGASKYPSQPLSDVALRAVLESRKTQRSGGSNVPDTH